MHRSDTGEGCRLGESTPMSSLGPFWVFNCRTHHRWRASCCDCASAERSSVVLLLEMNAWLYHTKQMMTYTPEKGSLLGHIAFSQTKRESHRGSFLGVRPWRRQRRPAPRRAYSSCCTTHLAGGTNGRACKLETGLASVCTLGQAWPFVPPARVVQPLEYARRTCPLALVA